MFTIVLLALMVNLKMSIFCLVNYHLHWISLTLILNSMKKPNFRKIIFLVEIVPELNHAVISMTPDSVLEVTDISNVGNSLQSCVESFHNDSFVED